MTHEAGIEAAYEHLEGYPDVERVERIIQAYLSASGMVLVPSDPTEQMMKSELDKAVYKAYLADAPNPFKSKP